MEQQKPLLLERGLSRLGSAARENRIPLLASILFGLLAYGFSITNKLVNHDEVQSLFEKGATIGSGRWGLELCERIFPNVSMPWIYGLLTIGLIAVSVCFIVRIFDIKNNLLQVLLAGSIAVFPSLTSTMAYIFTSSSFALAFFLAVLAVWLIREPTKITVIPALGCMVLSLGIYQSYISLASGLLVLILIHQLLSGRDVKTVVQRGVLYLAFLVICLGCYYILTRLALRIAGAGFNGYASSNLSFRLSDLPGRVCTAYDAFFRFFRKGHLGLMPTSLSRVMHTALLIASVLFLILLACRCKKEIGRLALLAALVGILPLAINCMYLFTTEDAVHTLVLYGFVSFYILIAVLAECCLSVIPRRTFADLLRQIGLEGSAAAMALILVTNIYIANMVSLNLYLRYENAYAFYTALAADIQMQPEFSENTKLALIGNYQVPPFFYENLGEIDGLTGTTGFLPDNYSKDRFVEYYIGFPISFASEEDIQAISPSSELAEMPVYPYYGSMRSFGDLLVVKLS